MPRDECQDCERPITPDDSAAFDGRCSPCHIAFLDRQPKAKKKAAAAESEEEE